MLDIKTYASGSSGNLYRVSDSSTTLVLECGIRFREIRQAFQFKLSQVDGCLLSHCHADHSKAAKDLMKAGVPVYMSAGTAEQLSLTGHRAKIVKPLVKFQVGSFTILPFPTEHDCPEPFGYLIQSKTGDKLVFATDTYYLKYRFSGVNYYMIECNYCKDLLAENIENGLLHPAMESRIKESHFEFGRVKEFFKAQNLSRARGIWLIHVSRGNGDPERFKSEIEAMTGVPVFVGCGDI